MSKECVNEKVMVIRNDILDSDDECEDHDSQLVEEIAPYDDEYVEEGNSISQEGYSMFRSRKRNLKIKGKTCSTQDV